MKEEMNEFCTIKCLEMLNFFPCWTHMLWRLQKEKEGMCGTEKVI